MEEPLQVIMEPKISAQKKSHQGPAGETQSEETVSSFTRSELEMLTKEAVITALSELHERRQKLYFLKDTD
ncbi:hypothetical protein NDU88_003251 [Pleurodeles waltl]|uniref:Uncharacterized protein n=1 Tax=Pleurodeles waltl TaxID=8319 RepID=A0AAV7UZL8_PLEWA|nr:hypothetical protein NDU88_003251 [Pleurodeles waltl]